jgi:hypothetical protein
MSNADRRLEDLLALEHACRTCQAQRGEWCRIRPGYKGAGKPAQFLHADRTWSTYHARWVGYTQGQIDMLEQIEYRIGLGGQLVGQVLEDLRQQAERWAQSAHQRALEDIPEGWHR